MLLSSCGGVSDVPFCQKDPNHENSKAVELCVHPQSTPCSGSVAYSGFVFDTGSKVWGGVL